ncbi:MAG: hypothetical protein Q4C13_08915, partial [Clostridia bacterium]|nr:hypothetical protein [Clostridia bacterium]
MCIVDIGSNSIRAMKAERAAGAPGFFPKQLFTTRLADGLLLTGRLQPEPIARSLEALKSIRAFAEQEGLRIRAYATSAVRDAANREDFLIPAEALLGSPVDVLNGEREANYAYKGAAGGEGGLIDIGGGSTQIVTRDRAISCPIGCVRARDACPEQRDFDALRAGLLPLLDSLLPLPAFPAMGWTGVGGTVTSLAALSLGLERYACAAVHGCVL